MSETQTLLGPSAPVPEYALPPQQGVPPPVYQQPPPGYQQPPPGYQQQAYQPVTAPPPATQTIVLNNTVAVFGDTPQNLRCPNCQRDVVTSVHYETGMLTWLLVFLLFFLGFWLCCCIPCCIDSTKDAIHTCPNCRHVCGVHKKLG